MAAPKSESKAASSSSVVPVAVNFAAPELALENIKGEIIRKRVQTARDIQNQRFANSTDIVCNADMRIGEVRQFCQLQPEGQSLMRAAMS